MFDYIKLNLFQTTPKEVLNNPLLEFVTDLNISTGEIVRSRQTAYFQSPASTGLKGTDLKVIIENERFVKVEFSLHKFWHGGNQTDYNYRDFLDTVYFLYQKLNINPFIAKIENLEFGVNIVPPVNTDELIFDWIINYKGEIFNNMIPPPPLGIVHYANNYQLKIYNKGRQYELPYNLLRYEYKAKRMWELNNKLQVFFLSDLLQPSLIPLFTDKLISTIDDLLIYDYRINKNDLNKSQRKYLKFDNPKYWKRLKQKDRKTHDYQRKVFKNIFKTNCSPFIGDQLKELVKEKFTSLSTLNISDGKYLLSMWEEFKQGIDINNLAKLTGGKNYSFSQINSYSIRLITLKSETDNKRYCKSCGRDISGQKLNSVFCSEKIFGKEAKKCRNKDSNPRNHVKRKIESWSSSPMIFSIDEMIAPIAEKVKQLGIKQ